MFFKSGAGGGVIYSLPLRTSAPHPLPVLAMFGQSESGLLAIFPPKTWESLILKVLINTKTARSKKKKQWHA